MTLRHMRILVAVFQQGSVTKAAQALHLAQPSVSLALRELEDYYGVALFTRTGRQLLPTVCRAVVLRLCSPCRLSGR